MTSRPDGASHRWKVKGGRSPVRSGSTRSKARALYERNWLRIIADVEAPGAAVLPARDPEGELLDLSLSTLRTLSPLHLE